MREKLSRECKSRPKPSNLAIAEHFRHCFRAISEQISFAVQTKTCDRLARDALNNGQVGMVIKAGF